MSITVTFGNTAVVIFDIRAIIIVYPQSKEIKKKHSIFSEKTGDFSHVSMKVEMEDIDANTICDSVVILPLNYEVCPSLTSHNLTFSSNLLWRAVDYPCICRELTTGVSDLI